MPLIDDQFPLKAFNARLDEVRGRLDQLERPTGTSVGSLVAQVQMAVANLATAVTTYLASGFTTGSMHATGRVTADGGVTSADVKSRTLSVGYDSVYIDANNIMGKSPSARRFKQDIEDHEFSADVVDLMQGKSFRLIAAVEALGDDAPREVGYIADELEAIGLEEFVRYDEDGQISGLAYERIVVVAIDSLKDARREIAAIKTHLGI